MKKTKGQGSNSKVPRKPYVPAIYYQNLRIIKERGSRCEECNQENGLENKFTGKLIKLQVCHRNQNPADHSKSNVAVWCQWCHAQWDREYKLQHGLD